MTQQTMLDADPTGRRVSMPRPMAHQMIAWSLWAPYSGLVIDGVKTIETRTWWSDYRGEIAIHGAQKVDREAMTRLGSKADGYDATQYRGALLGIVRIVDCLPLRPEDEEATCFYGPGCRAAFVLEVIRKLGSPVPWKGQQGPFLIPREAVGG